jgi:hypothetical protein
MGRYVLLLRAREPGPRDLERIAGTPGVTIVESMIQKALLIDASEQAITDLRAFLKDWLVVEEVTYPRPGPARKKVERKDAAKSGSM